LVDEARRAGVEGRLLGPGEEAAELAREAADAGARTLGVAGGDGTLRAVAAVAIERDLPFVVVPFGTRNHFARDAGLDPDDPVGALRAFRGAERRVDLGVADGGVFLNNVSLGIYGSFVHDPAKKTKNRLLAFFRMAGAAFGRSRQPLRLSFEVDGERKEHRALALLVGNNDYSLRSLADLGKRERLDGGCLHAALIEATTRRRLLGLLARAVAGRVESAHSWSDWTAASFRIDSDRPRVHAALDGEPVVLEPPLEFVLRPRALRLLVPPPRDGVDPGSGAS
jgi:diacylglycerol kinase family enzyme